VRASARGFSAVSSADVYTVNTVTVTMYIRYTASTQCTSDGRRLNTRFLLSCLSLFVFVSVENTFSVQILSRRKASSVSFFARRVARNAKGSRRRTPYRSHPVRWYHCDGAGLPAASRVVRNNDISRARSRRVAREPADTARAGILKRRRRWRRLTRPTRTRTRAPHVSPSACTHPAIVTTAAATSPYYAPAPAETCSSSLAVTGRPVVLFCSRSSLARVRVFFFVLFFYRLLRQSFSQRKRRLYSHRRDTHYCG